jgi:hypothetical protein
MLIFSFLQEKVLTRLQKEKLTYKFAEVPCTPLTQFLTEKLMIESEKHKAEHKIFNIKLAYYLVREKCSLRHSRFGERDKGKG